MKRSILFMKSLLIMSVFFMVSCNDDDTVSCPEAISGDLTAVETEFAGKWELKDMVAEEAIDITEDKTENPLKDIYAQLPACKQDLYFSFDGRDYVEKQGYTAEDCTNKASLKGTWKLAGDNLVFVASCTTQSLKIEFNEDKTEFYYSSTLTFQDQKEGLKTTKVTFTYAKESEPGV